MLVSTIRRTGANEAYVASYLQRSAGFDSFTVEYLMVRRTQLCEARLSVWSADTAPVAGCGR